MKKDLCFAGGTRVCIRVRVKKKKRTNYYLQNELYFYVLIDFLTCGLVNGELLNPGQKVSDQTLVQ